MVQLLMQIQELLLANAVNIIIGIMIENIIKKMTPEERAAKKAEHKDAPAANKPQEEAATAS